jgi:RNA polymerase sigma-70 factor, ECF subfamily
VDDSTLVARAASGDEAAFELLIRRHTDAVWRMAITLLADSQVAEEAVQDTFIKAYRGLSGFRGEAAVRTWLLASATGAASTVCGCDGRRSCRSSRHERCEPVRTTPTCG